MRLLTETERRVAAAWDVAAADLGVALIRSAAVPVAHVVWVEGFGSASGAICALIDAPDREALRVWANEHSAFSSFLADAYGIYDRNLFVGTLEDWGWQGSDDPPSWYTGAPWTA